MAENTAKSSMLAIPTATEEHEEEITAEMKKSGCSVSRSDEPASKELRVESSPSASVNSFSIRRHAKEQDSFAQETRTLLAMQSATATRFCDSSARLRGSPCQSPAARGGRKSGWLARGPDQLGELTHAGRRLPAHHSTLSNGFAETPSGPEAPGTFKGGGGLGQTGSAGRTRI